MRARDKDTASHTHTHRAQLAQIDEHFYAYPPRRPSVVVESRRLEPFILLKATRTHACLAPTHARPVELPFACVHMKKNPSVQIVLHKHTRARKDARTHASVHIVEMLGHITRAPRARASAMPPYVMLRATTSYVRAFVYLVGMHNHFPLYGKMRSRSLAY